MKKIIQILVLTGLTLNFAACAADSINGATGGDGNNGQVTLGVLDGELASVSIPSEYFGTGSDDDLEISRLDVSVNDQTIAEDIDPSDSSFFNQNTDAVEFNISSLAEGDVVLFTITDPDGFEDAYTATVSASEEQFAVSATE